MNDKRTPTELGKQMANAMRARYPMQGIPQIIFESESLADVFERRCYSDVEIDEFKAAYRTAWKK